MKLRVRGTKPSFGGRIRDPFEKIVTVKNLDDLKSLFPQPKFQIHQVIEI